MAKPENSIASIKMPGENTQRPIIPYSVSDGTYEYTLDYSPNADGQVVVRSPNYSTLLVHDNARQWNSFSAIQGGFIGQRGLTNITYSTTWMLPAMSHTVDNPDPVGTLSLQIDIVDLTEE